MRYFHEFAKGDALRFAPLVFVFAYWLDSPWAMVAATLFLPLTAYLQHPRLLGKQPRRALEFALADARKNSALFVLGLDGFPDWIGREGSERYDEIMARLAERLDCATRDNDHISRVDACFAVLVSDIKDPAQARLCQIAARLQKSLAEPLIVEGNAIYLTCSVGILRLPSPDLPSPLDAALAALEDARRAGSAQIRLYDKSLRRRVDASAGLTDEVDRALSSGEIRAWFQPQISAETGQISGFEALARWHHPRLGVLAPGAFLDIIEARGKSERLAEVILLDALRALSAWDQAGIKVPTVGVNYSTDQLRNPRLAEHLKWEVDRFDLAPDRITVEVLETVISDREGDVIAQNIRALAAHGFPVDLDDFGTGHASIANIRRFAVSRLKIDRSFITALDKDPGQQAMARAIIQMADGLGLDCVAEGVETDAEWETLARMGCRYLQGFGIARPMPFEESLAWIERHQAQPARWRDSA